MVPTSFLDSVFEVWILVVGALAARSPPMTASGGEFDWGGTSVKGTAGFLRTAQRGQKPRRRANGPIGCP